MMKTHPILNILNRWPSRQSIVDDVNLNRPKHDRLDLVAVHRWFQRKSVPSKYDLALIDDASKRNIPLNWLELMKARSAPTDQDGHQEGEFQGAVQ